MKIKPVKGYEGLYEVSDSGKVFSLKFGRSGNKRQELKPFYSLGYARVSLSKDKTKRQYRVHVIVMDAFSDRPTKKHNVNHKNGVKSDNRFCNLEWMTQSENLLHAFKVLKKNVKRPKPIQCTKTDGSTVVFKDAKEATEKTRLKIYVIRSAARDRSKTTNGWQWSYA